MLKEYVEKLKSSQAGSRDIQWCEHYEKQFLKVKQMIIWLSNSTSKVYNQEREKHVTQNLYIHVQSSITHNKSKWKEPKCPSVKN